MKLTSPKAGNLSPRAQCRSTSEMSGCVRAQGQQRLPRRSGRDASAWERIGERPDLKGLHAEVRAEVLLTVGILTSWIGSKEGIENAQETAKNLISESIGPLSGTGGH